MNGSRMSAATVDHRTELLELLDRLDSASTDAQPARVHRCAVCRRRLTLFACCSLHRTPQQHEAALAQEDGRA